MNQTYPLVSVIIPVYNAEMSIHSSLDSLKNQTYPSLELIFVNDCSVDSSIDVISNYKKNFAERGFQVNIISHMKNMGVAAARNTGLDAATGDYICWLDADDLLIESAIEEMINKLEEEESDIISCDWYLSFEKNARYMNQPAISTPRDAIEKMLLGKMRWNLWLFIAKRTLYEENKIRFVPGKNMGEDLFVTIKLFASAHRVTYLNKALYSYSQNNVTSLTKQYHSKHIEEVTDNVNEVANFLENNGILGTSLQDLVNCLKLNIKLPLLVSGKKESYSLWQTWFKEANKYSFVNKALPFRTRLLQLMAFKKQYWYVWGYYNLIFKLVYGIIYK